MGKRRTVQPITDLNIILDIRDYLRARNERDHLLFVFGIYTGFRISDILDLRVRDVKRFIEDESVYIKEKKTKNDREIDLHPALEKILKDYIKGKKDYEYLFASRKKTPDGIHKNITREHAGRVLKEAANEFGLKRINTHTMRKTFGYFLYKQTKGDIMQVKEALGQSDISSTKRYIGLTEELVNDSILKLDFERDSRKNRK